MQAPPRGWRGARTTQAVERSRWGRAARRGASGAAGRGSPAARALLRMAQRALPRPRALPSAGRPGRQHRLPARALPRPRLRARRGRAGRRRPGRRSTSYTRRATRATPRCCCARRAATGARPQTRADCSHPTTRARPSAARGSRPRLGVGRLGARLLVEWEAAAGSDSDSSPALARGAGRGARSPPAGIPESPPPSAERAGEDASLSGASLFEVLQSRLKNSAARRGALRPGGSLTGLAALPAGRAPCAPPPPLPAAASPGECAAARPGKVMNLKTQRALHHPRSRDARESRGGPDEKPHGVRVALPAPDDFLLA